MLRRDGVIERPESIPSDQFARSVAAAALENDDHERPINHADRGNYSVDRDRSVDASADHGPGGNATLRRDSAIVRRVVSVFQALTAQGKSAKDVFMMFDEDGGGSIDHEELREGFALLGIEFRDDKNEFMEFLEQCGAVSEEEIEFDLFEVIFQNLATTSTKSRPAFSARSIEIDALLAFTFDHTCWDWPTWKVVRDIVKPATLIGQGNADNANTNTETKGDPTSCSYADLKELRPFTQPLVHGGGTIYICHCWGAAWGDVVLSAVHGACNSKRQVFIDVLCLDQHLVDLGDSDIFSFRDTIPMCRAMVVAMSPLLSLQEFMESEDDRSAFLASVKGHHAKMINPFFRLACLLEIAQAVHTDVDVVVKCGSAVATPDPRPFSGKVCVHFDTTVARESHMLQNLMSGLIDAETAACHSPIVRQRLMSAVHELDGDGFAWIESAVEGEIVSAISSMAYSVLEVDAAACGEFAALDAMDIPGGCTGDTRNRVGNVLLAACAGNRVHLVKTLLKNWSTFSSVDDSSETTLSTDWVCKLIDDSLAVWSAANGGHSRVVDALLSVPGVSGAETMHAGVSALFVASQNGHAGVVRTLLRHRGQHHTSPVVVRHCQSPGNKERPTINLSSLADASNVFQSMRTIVNRPTPFSVAVQHGHVDVVRELLEASSDGLLDPPINVNAKILGKQLPLRYAMRKDYSQLAVLLRATGARDGDERQRDEAEMLSLGHEGDTDGLGELLQAWFPGGEKVMGEIQDEEDIADDGMHSPGSPQAALILTAAKRLCTMVNGCRVLWHAAAAGHTETVELLLKVHRRLIDVGVAFNMNVAIADGSTALFVSCERGFADIVELLLGCDEVDVNACDDKRTTPLNVACYDGRKDIVKLLLATFDVDLTIKDAWGDTAQSTARKSGHKEVYAMVQKASQRQLARSLR